MNIQITFRDFPPSDAIRSYVERRATKVLARVERLVSCKVALESPHRHRQHGHSYRVRIDVVVPGHEIVISPKDGADGHTDLYAAIDDAFDDAERRLRDHASHRRDEVKPRAAG